MKTPADRLELRQRIYLQQEAQSRFLTRGLIALFVILIGISLLLVPIETLKEIGDFRSLLERLLEAMRNNFLGSALNILIFAMLAAQMLYMRWAKRLERLVLTPVGIEYHSPLPEVLRFLRPGWSLSWGQIRSISLKKTVPGSGPQLTQLELTGGNRKFKLHPWHWADPKTYKPDTLWDNLRRGFKITSGYGLQEVEESPLMRYLTAALPDLKINNAGKLASTAFALEKNRASLVIIIAFFLLVAYTIADWGIFGEETYAGEVPMPWFIGLGVLGATVAALWMVRSEVPIAEAAMVALLFGGSVGGAAYPGTLRINALTDQVGLQTHEYVLQPDLSLTPVKSGPPDLSFPRYCDYWREHDSGSIHEFELRYGGLGFYQLNFEPVRKALRAYYEKKYN